MPATRQDFIIERAEDITFTFTQNQSDGQTAQNITGWTIAFRATTSQYGAATVTKTGVVTSGPQGTFTVTLASADTAGLTQDGADTVYWYDIRRTDASSRTELFEGTITVKDTFTNG